MKAYKPSQSSIGQYDSPERIYGVFNFGSENKRRGRLPQANRRQLFPSNYRRNHSLDRFQLPSITNKPRIEYHHEENMNKHIRLPQIEQQVKTPLQQEKPKNHSITLTPQVKGDKQQQFKDKDSHLSYSSRTKAGMQNGKQPKTNQDSMMIDPDILHLLSVNGENNFINGVRAFGVFDGHGLNGHLVSQMIKAKLPQHLHRYLSPLNGSLDSQQIKDAITKAYVATNQDVWMAEYDTNLSGSTVVSAIIYGNKVFCANTGDSRAIMARYGSGKYHIVNLSIDHKPGLQSEKERIIKSGGRVESQRDIYGHAVGPLRVWLSKIDLPGLAMTRSFGDKVGAQAGVIAEPEILEFTITPQDHFIIVASDGVWEYLSDQEVIRVVGQFYNNWQIELAAEQVMKQSLMAWKKILFGRDDISVIVIFLNHER